MTCSWRILSDGRFGGFVIAVTFLIEMVVSQPHPVKIAFISFR
ncbi:hypothetical protein YT1_1176 [Rhodococcus ruber]|nr:hypothetical protein YT1_1176 [Rhodococcus ruber]